MTELRREKYTLIEPILNEISFNCIFAKVVTNHWIDGCVYVDDEDKPSACYIKHPYGMSLLAGRANNNDFNEHIIHKILSIKRQSSEYLQVSSNKWHQLIRSYINSDTTNKKSIEEDARLNFKFNQLNKQTNTNLLNKDLLLTQTKSEDFNLINGSVIPKAFYQNECDFRKKGIGFSIYQNQKAISTAFAAFIHNNYLEIGIETLPKYRGNGLAETACLALIKYATKKHFIPVWSCTKSNTGSLKLAQKLGFKIERELPYFIIKPNPLLT